MATRRSWCVCAFALLVAGCGPDPLVGSWYSQSASGSATLEVEAQGAVHLTQRTRWSYATHPNCVRWTDRTGSYVEGGGGHLTVTVDATTYGSVNCPDDGLEPETVPQHQEPWRYEWNGTAITLYVNGQLAGRFARR